MMRHDPYEPSPWKAFLQRWAVTALAVMTAAGVIKGIDCESGGALLLASLLLGALNAFLRPIMLWLSLPLIILSFGLFALLINALLLYMVGAVVKGFTVAGLWSAFWGSLVISLVSLIANLFIGAGRAARILSEEERRARRRLDRPDDDFIDV